MTEARDPYVVLGISRGSSAKEIEEAFRRLAEIYDLERYREGGSGAREEAERRMRELRQARAILLARRKKLLRPRPVPTLPRRDLFVLLILLGFIVTVVLLVTR